MFPTEIWLRIVAYAGLLDKGRLHDVSCGLRVVTQEILEGNPPRFIDAIATDNVTILKASIRTLAMINYMTHAMLEAAVRARAWRIMVNYIYHLDPPATVEYLVHNECVDGAVLLEKRHGKISQRLVRGDDLISNIISLRRYSANPVARQRIMQDIMWHDEVSIDDYINCVHPDDLLCVLHKAIGEKGYFPNTDNIIESRRYLVLCEAIQHHVGK